jgi:hypothetical protein
MSDQDFQQKLKDILDSFYADRPADGSWYIHEYQIPEISRRIQDYFDNLLVTNPEHALGYTSDSTNARQEKAAPSEELTLIWVEIGDATTYRIHINQLEPVGASKDGTYEAYQRFQGWADKAIKDWKDVCEDEERG